MVEARTFDSKTESDPQQAPAVPAPRAAIFQVGPVDDVYEREAEATARRVMEALNEGGSVGTSLRLGVGVQRAAATVGAAGGEVSDGTATLIEQARGSGSELPHEVRRSMEAAFGGADFGAVRVHTGDVPGTLNERLSARAFTVGNDIFLGHQMPALDTSEGQHILAHELAHTRQQDGGALQRLFRPAATADKTTLRAGADGGAKKHGRSIPEGTEIVVDRTQQVVEHRRLSADEVWTLAADIRPEGWLPALAPANTYVRGTKLAPDKAYPVPEPSVRLPGRGGPAPERRWSDQIGEYIYLEDSPRGGGAALVRKPGLDGVRAFVPPGTLAVPNQHEKHRIDVVQLTTELKVRLTGILRTAAGRYNLDPDLFAKAAHVQHPTEDKGLMKVLRMASISGLDAEQFDRWYDWKENVIAKITTGADEAAASIEHWRQTLHPQQDQVRVTDIEIDGSDLHDRGLGAIFVKFTKPLGPPGSMFADKTNFKTVVKPEDRSIEKSLFGTDPSSLASRMDRLAGLDPTERIAKIKMQTHALHGTLIEFVAGTAARQLDGARAQMSPAGREAMALAYVAGLSDVHQDNVIWVNDRPYFIDADNALNASRLGFTEKPGFENQTGFTKYSNVGAKAEQGTIKNAPATSTSKIMQMLVDAGNPVPVVDAVRKTFAGKTGRVVPLFTNTWATSIKGGALKDDALVEQWLQPYFAKPVGTPRDAASIMTTRWALAAALAGWLPRGNPGKPEPGLEGESGIPVAGLAYDQGAAMSEIKADLDQGKIPFFTYEYDTGHVTMNGQVIWRGAPLAESLEQLLTTFPHQRGITDIP
jgi:hypothetical protein